MYVLFSIIYLKYFSDGEAFRVFRLQIAILNTHSNGRDTHIRQLKVYTVLP